jgi:hypothetical protein
MEMKESIKEQESAVVKIDFSLNERERLLEVVKESKSMLESNLLEEMKKEYYFKIQEMENEIDNLKTNH